LNTCRLSQVIFILVFLFLLLPALSNAQQDKFREAESLNQEVVKFYQQGRYSDAIRLAEKALAIYEKALGPDHPDVAQSLNNLASLYAAKGEFSKAHSLFIRAQGIDEKLIDQVVGFASEDRQTIFLIRRQSNLELALSLAAMHLKEDPSVRKDALDVWLRRKGIVLEAQRRFQEAIVYSDDPRVVSTFQELAKIRSQLSQLTFGGPGKEGQRRIKGKLLTWKSRKETWRQNLAPSAGPMP
jgi:tetratricopeptide (TPR) repeat protein